MQGLRLFIASKKIGLAESDALKNQIRLNADDVYAHYRLGLLLSFLELDVTRANEVALQPDGKIVAAGETQDVSSGAVDADDFALVRYTRHSGSDVRVGWDSDDVGRPRL